MTTVDLPPRVFLPPALPTHVPTSLRPRRRPWRGLLSAALATGCLSGFVALGYATDWKLPKPSAFQNETVDGAEDWCQEHGVADAECVECRPQLLPRNPAYKWCKEHGLPECPHCHPEVAELPVRPVITEPDLKVAARALAFAPRAQNDAKCQLHTRRIQLASDEVVHRLGLGVVPATRGPMSEAITASGEISFDPTRVARIGARASGIVWRVERRVGDKVRRGDLLAVVDAAEVGKAKAEFQFAVVQRELRRETLAKLRPQAGNTVSGRDLQAAEAAVEEAEVRVLAAESGLSNLGLPLRAGDVEGMTPAALGRRMQFLGFPEASIQELSAAGDSSNLLPVTAPLDGEVVAHSAVKDETAEPSRTLFVVADTSGMWLTLRVRPEDANRILPGQPVRFRHAGHVGPAAWDPGAVVWISPAADEKTRMVPVRVNLPEASDRHYANTSGTAEVILREEAAAVVVPATALHWEGCCHVVFVRDKDYDKPGGPRVFHVRKVRPGGRTATPEGARVEIAAGLLPGEVVAAANSGFLRSELLKNNLGEGCACCAGK